MKKQAVIAYCVAMVIVSSPAAAMPRYGDWSEGTFLSAVNTTAFEFANAISKNGLTFYFQRGDASINGEDIWVAQRQAMDAPWEAPQKLPASINSTSNDRAAFESPDGHWLFYASDRPGGRGGFDLMVAWRPHTHAGPPDFGWQDAVNLDATGSTINTPGFDSGPTAFEDAAGRLHLYLVSNPAGPQNLLVDIYLAIQKADGSFGPRALVEELNSAFNEGRPSISHSGLEIYFNSNRPPGPPTQADIWVSTRATTTDSWSTPQIVPVISTTANEITPVLSWDGTTLFFASNRSGNPGDIFYSSRAKARGGP